MIQKKSLATQRQKSLCFINFLQMITLEAPLPPPPPSTQCNMKTPMMIIAYLQLAVGQILRATFVEFLLFVG